jgi:hypothetical protein
MPEYRVEGPLPYRFIPCGRAYSNVVFDPSTQLIVAASSLQARFASYDEDGNRVWEPDGTDLKLTLRHTPLNFLQHRTSQIPYVTARVWS